MPRTFRGLAAFEGVGASFDVILYPIAQSGKATHNFNEEIIQDEHGDDAAWLARNEHITADFGMKLLGDTAAHALAGAAFLAPLAVVAITAKSSGSLPAVLVGSWTIMNGSEIDLGNTKTGDITFKLRKYVNSTQNTSAITTPS